MAFEQHIQKSKDYQKAYYQKHKEKKLKYAKEYLEKNKEEINKRRRKLRAKDDPTAQKLRNLGVPWKDRRKYNKIYHIEIRAAELLKTKIKALQIISGLKKPECCKCKCSDIRALIINHINGDGNKERASDTYTYASAFRKAIILGERKTDDLDVRCHNCNIIYEYERNRLRLPDNWEAIYSGMVID